MPQRVLVAVDLSEASSVALKSAFALASAREAELALVHVLPSVVDIQVLFPQNYAENLAASVEFEARVGREIEARLAAEGARDTRVFLERGEARAEIVRRAQEWSADWIVVGSHGHSALARVPLGSVAERVVRDAPCSVLVARSPGGARVVVAATDLSEASRQALVAAAHEARARGARLVILHAVDFSEAARIAAAGAFFGASLPAAEQRRDAALGEVAGRVRAWVAQSTVEGDVSVLDGPAVGSVVRRVEELGAELLVVGAHGQTGLARISLGGVAERMVRFAACSVLAVR